MAEGGTRLLLSQLDQAQWVAQQIRGKPNSALGREACYGRVILTVHSVDSSEG